MSDVKKNITVGNKVKLSHQACIKNNTNLLYKSHFESLCDNFFVNNFDHFRRLNPVTLKTLLSLEHSFSV